MLPLIYPWPDIRVSCLFLPDRLSYSPYSSLRTLPTIAAGITAAMRSIDLTALYLTGLLTYATEIIPYSRQIAAQAATFVAGRGSKIRSDQAMAATDSIFSQRSSSQLRRSYRTKGQLPMC